MSYENRMHLFADNRKMQPESDEIVLSCDGSLDEGDAIIKAKFSPNWLSVGEEYFVQLRSWEATWLIELLEQHLENNAHADDIDDVQHLCARIHRLRRYKGQI